MHAHPHVRARTTRTQVYQEGTHLMLPWFERAIIFDVRARPSLIQSQSGSRDLQMVRLRVRCVRCVRCVCCVEFWPHGRHTCTPAK
jgi:hypothetical protein